LKTRIIVAAILIPAFFVILFLLPPFAITALIAVICACAAFELLDTVSELGISRENEQDAQYPLGIAPFRLKLVTAAMAVIIPVAIYGSNSLNIFAPPDGISSVGAHQATAFSSTAEIISPIESAALEISSKIAAVFPEILFIFIGLVLYQTVSAYNRRIRITLVEMLAAIFGGIIIPFMLSCIVSLRAMPHGIIFVLLPIVCACMTDTGAYFTGVTIGRRKAFPLISPKKTMEGCAGGLIIGTIGIVLYGVIIEAQTVLTVEYYRLIIYGITGSLFTQLGDLIFSLVKRECGIKDYGRLMPGHGGALDRFDSMILAAPAMYLMVTSFPAIY